MSNQNIDLDSEIDWDNDNWEVQQAKIERHINKLEHLLENSKSPEEKEAIQEFLDGMKLAHDVAQKITPLQ